MPRRMISPELWRNEKVGSLPDTGRLLFIGMFSNADDDGRLKASPRYLRALIFSYDTDKTNEDVRQLRDQCAELGLIRVYSINGCEYLDIPGWEDHQMIRKDRYRPSRLPGYDEVAHDETTMCKPDGNPTATSGDHSKVKVSPVKASSPKGGRRKTPSPLKETARTMCAGDLLSTVKPDNKDDRAKDVPAKRQKRPPDPRVNEIQVKMKRYLGYPERTSKDPIPSYGKEGKAIKRMLDRLFTPEEILACWQAKVEARDGDYVNMTWVNEDIGKKQGPHPSMGRSRNGRWPRDLPEKYTPAPKYRDD